MIPLGEFEIPDDSGIIAVVDAARYTPFIGPYWTLEQILGRFCEAMQQHCLLVWSPGCEGNWRVVACLGEPLPGACRSAEATIRVTGPGLHLVSYDSLTMAAQFPDEPIPQPHEQGNLIRLSEGLYTCNVAQFFPPDESQTEAVFAQSGPHFRLSFRPSLDALPPWSSVQWLVL